MSSEEVKRISPEELIVVQNYIEQCLQRHMNLNEVKNTLLVKDRIDPEITEFAWKKLEEGNPEFFKAYHLRLLVKDQIEKFNSLLERQAELMNQLSTGPPAVHMSNGSHILPMSQNSALYGQEYMESTLHQPLGSSLYLNGGSSSVHPCMQSPVDMSNEARRINTSSNMLMTPGSNMGLVQGVNGQMMATETGYINGSHFMVGPNGEVPSHHANVNLPISSYISVESHPQPINNNTFFGDNAAYESLEHIPRSFGLSDPTTNFSLDILESYPGSSFLAAGSDDLVNPQYRVQQVNGRLDKISEGLSYDVFGRD